MSTWLYPQLNRYSFFTCLVSSPQTMREVMIPAYEAATSQMFQQTSTSLEKGLAQMSVNHSNASASTLQAMSNQMMKMGEAIQSLTAELAQLRGDIKANSENGAATKSQPSAPQPPMGIRNEITALCQAQRYEEAFTKAVSASDGEIVLFACQQADSAAVFGNGEVSISQPILICLLQQLGAVLVTASDVGDIKTILTWLQEIAVTIDPTNPNIQRRKFTHYGCDGNVYDVCVMLSLTDVIFLCVCSFIFQMLEALCNNFW